MNIILVSLRTINYILVGGLPLTSAPTHCPWWCLDFLSLKSCSGLPVYFFSLPLNKEEKKKQKQV